MKFILCVKQCISSSYEIHCLFLRENVKLKYLGNP